MDEFKTDVEQPASGYSEKNLDLVAETRNRNICSEKDAQLLCCSVCGVHIDCSQQFCQNCGTRIEQNNASSRHNKCHCRRTRNKNAIVKIALFVLLVAVVAVSIFLVWNHFIVKTRTDKIAKIYQTAMKGSTNKDLIKVAGDHSWIKFDSSPDDMPYENLDYSAQTESDNNLVFVFSQIAYALKSLNFPTSTIEKMQQTSSIQGVQTVTANDYSVSWTYHPDNGIEAIIEYKK